MVDVPHFAFPLRLGRGGSFAVVEQDSVDDITQSVQVLLSTPVGSRIELPEYGVEALEFTTVVDRASIVQAINDWEPRADVTVDDQLDSTDKLLRHIRVTVTSGGNAE
jgi:phage baseplate assembly protein W